MFCLFYSSSLYFLWLAPKNTLNLKLNRNNVENPWFVFGVLYPGALSAWFRLKFPHITCGSLASSAVVRDVYNFTEFDQQIADSVGPECKAALQEVTQLIEQRLESSQKELKSAFGASELKIDGDFLYFVADAAIMAFQYGNPNKLCSPLVEAMKTGKYLVDTYASFVKDYFLEEFGVCQNIVKKIHLKNTVPGEDSSDRLWWFQVCTEVAYFQVAYFQDF